MFNWINRFCTFSLVVIIILLNTNAQAQSKSVIDSINKVDFVYLINNLSQMESVYEQNLKSAEKINYTKGKAESLSRLSLIEYYLNEFDKGIAYNIQAVKLFEKLNDKSSIVNSYSDLAYAIRQLDTKMSLYYFRQAIKQGEKYHTDFILGKTYDNYGVVLQETKLDSAIYFYKKSLGIKKRLKDTIGIPYSLNKLAIAYAIKRDFKTAFNYMNLSDSYRKKENNKQGIADNYAYRGDIFNEMKQLDSAVFYFEKSLKLGKEVNFQSLVRYSFDQLKNLYAQRKNFQKAYEYTNLLKAFDDSIYTIESASKIASLQVEFETEKKQKEIAEQKFINAKQSKINTDNKLQLETRKKWIIVFGGLLVVLTGGAIFIYYSQLQKRKTEKQAIEFNGQLAQANLERQFAEEKLKISKELHDNIGSHLTFMISSVDNLVYQEKEPAKIEKLNYISNFGRSSMKDLRSTIWAMKQDEGTLEELMLKLTELKQALSSQLEIQFEQHAPDGLILNSMQLLNTYRIIQECIQNTIKYAEATSVHVTIDFVQHQVELSISDDGHGFDLNAQSQGNGLTNMKWRAEELGGKCDISSSEGGTHIQFSYPIESKKKRMTS